MDIAKSQSWRIQNTLAVPSVAVAQVEVEVEEALAGDFVSSAIVL